MEHRLERHFSVMDTLRNGLAALFGLALRLLFVAAGLVFAASLLFAMLVLLGYWLVRAGWARLTGRPITPWRMRMDPRAGWSRFYQAGEQAAGRAASRQQRRGPPGQPGALLDVSDAEIKQPRD